jgi:hypothetical protein
VPLSPPTQPLSGPGRRSLLTGVVLAATTPGLLVGCSKEPAGERAERSSAAWKLREHSARESRALLARYDATARAHPALAGRLRLLRAEVAAHAAAFTSPTRSGSPSPATSASPAPSVSSGSLGPRPPAPKVPKDEGQALAALADAERRTAEARTTALLHAPAELARLLASVAAAGAAHAYLLTEGG